MLYDRDTFEHNGNTFRFRTEYDDTHGAPWVEEDGHGPVSEWTTRAKRPGERVLCRDGRSYRYYDFQQAVALAKRDGWDAEPYRTGSRGETATRAAEADFRRLNAWCEDRWNYVGVIVNLVDDFGDDMEGTEHSLWGIESDAFDYHEVVARELALECQDLALRA
jgi:hypothetical protein